MYAWNYRYAKKEEQLEEAQQLIDSLFTHSQEAFILFDLFGHIIRVNEKQNVYLDCNKRHCRENTFRHYSCI